MTATRRALHPDILTHLVRKTGKQESTIRKDISILHQKYAGLPINSVAQIYALQNTTSILRKLSKEERTSVPLLDVQKPIPVVTSKSSTPRRPRKILQFVKYDSKNTFIKAHIVETNKAYTHGCYTATFILARKILENLLTDIIRNRYRQDKLENIELHYNTSQGRSRDFSEILKNLQNRSKDFGPDKNLLERILTKAKDFKDNSNDKTHSWYHIVRTKKELDETNYQDIMDMLVELEEHIRLNTSA